MPCWLARALDQPSVSHVVVHEAKELQDEARFTVLFNEFLTIHSMEELWFMGDLFLKFRLKLPV